MSQTLIDFRLKTAIYNFTLSLQNQSVCFFLLSSKVGDGWATLFKMGSSSPESKKHLKPPRKSPWNSVHSRNSYSEHQRTTPPGYGKNSAKKPMKTCSYHQISIYQANGGINESLGKGGFQIFGESGKLVSWGGPGSLLLLMEKILNQLRLVVYPSIYRLFAPSQVVVWDFFHQQ